MWSVKTVAPRFTIIITTFSFVLMTAITGAVDFGAVRKYTLQALDKIQNL